MLTFWEPLILLSPSIENKHSGIINQCKMKQRGPAQLIWNWFNDSPVNTHLPSGKQESRLISTDMPLSAPCSWQSHLDLAWFANIKKKKTKPKTLWGSLSCEGRWQMVGRWGTEMTISLLLVASGLTKSWAFLRRGERKHQDVPASGLRSKSVF